MAVPRRDGAATGKNCFTCARWPAHGRPHSYDSVRNAPQCQPSIRFRSKDRSNGVGPYTNWSCSQTPQESRSDDRIRQRLKSKITNETFTCSTLRHTWEHHPERTMDLTRARIYTCPEKRSCG